MKTKLNSWLHGFWQDEHGQILPVAVSLLVVFLGLSGLSIDVGHLYLVRSQLQNTANGAALAAAGSVWNSDGSSSTVSSAATNFIAKFYNVDFSSGAQSAGPIGTLSVPSISTTCLKAVLGQACTSSSADNAVRVSLASAVPTYFMGIFGVKTVNVSATATASMLGPAQPWNVAIILDVSASMATADTYCSNKSRLNCALEGIRTMLAAVNPCKSDSSCSTDDSVFRVSVFATPAVSTATVSRLYASTSGCSQPNWMMYPLTPAGASGTTPITYAQTSSGSSGRSWGSGSSSTASWTATHQVLYSASDADSYGFASNYFSTTSSNGLNASSSLVKTVSGCLAPMSVWGSGTGAMTSSGSGQSYFASAIYAAQAALLAEQSQHSGSKNAIIFLSDGQANITSYLPSSSSWTVSSGSGVLATGNTTGAYPSYWNECQQTIVASQAATRAGTRVYSVAYGSQSSGCRYGTGGTDYSTVATGTVIPFTYQTLTPCVAMANTASSADYFYSDWNQSGSGSSCQDASHTTTSLQDIFLSIAGTFTNPRLLPNNAT